MVPVFNIDSNQMVDEQLKRRNIKSKAVLDAMKNVPRHLFVPEDKQAHAYGDYPLSIGFGQTISQPYIVAYMTELLEHVSNGESGLQASSIKILEIGTGSGYQASVLGYLGYDVYTIELLEDLANKARKILSDLNFDNVKVKHGNGYLGWPEAAPFDVIIVTAAPEKLPEKLIEQLKDGGKMIIPVGEVHSTQSLKLIFKKDKKIIEKDLLPVRFVPMVEVQ